jgi:hypothetical protein
VSIRTSADSVSGLNLLLDAAGYGAVAGLGQALSHKIFARERLPKDEGELLTRYVAGVTIGSGACTVWVLHRYIRNIPTSAADAVAMQWLVFGASGLVVAALHYHDAQVAKAAEERGKRLGADALRKLYEDQEHERRSAQANRIRRP